MILKKHLSTAFFIFYALLFLFALIKSEDKKNICNLEALLEVSSLIDSFSNYGDTVHNYLEKVDLAINQMLSDLDTVCVDSFEGPTGAADDLLLTITDQMPTIQALSIALSSAQDVSFFMRNNQVIAMNPQNPNITYDLKPGDHNIWFNDEGQLFGYDQCGQLFTLKEGRRVALGATSCCRMFP